MKLVIFPDIVMKYFQKNEDVQKIINTGTEKRLEFFCHQIVLDEISGWLSSGVSPELEEFKKHIEVFTKKLPVELMKKAKQQASNDGQAFILALAEKLKINIIWSDNERIISQFPERNTTTTELVRELPKMKPRFIGLIKGAQTVIHRQTIWDNPPITLPPESIIAEEEKSAEIPGPSSDERKKIMNILIPYLTEELKKSLKYPGLPMVTYNHNGEPEIDYIPHDQLPKFKMASEIRHIFYAGEEDGHHFFELYEYKRREGQKWLEPWEHYSTEAPYLYFDLTSFFINKRGDIISNYSIKYLVIKVSFNKEIVHENSASELMNSSTSHIDSRSVYPFAENKYYHLSELLPQGAIDECNWEEKFSNIDMNGLERYFGLRKASLKADSDFLHVRFNPDVFPENCEYIFDITELKEDLKKKHDAKLKELYKIYGFM